MESEAAAAHRALEAVWARLYAEVDGARFERRGDLLFALYPPFAIPQCNGPWVVEDTQAAAAELPEAIAEVEASGAWPWVQTRSGHDRTQRAAAELGLTEREALPGMVIRPDELVAPSAGPLSIGLIAASETAAANALVARSFGLPEDLIDSFSRTSATLEEACWYVGRIDDEVVATGLGITIEDVTGVFNVATASEHRGRGHGAALTARVVEDGFASGSRLAFLQSSRLGHGVYTRIGFRDVEEYVLLTRPGVEIR